jgi:hypothetical protein
LKLECPGRVSRTGPELNTERRAYDEAIDMGLAGGLGSFFIRDDLVYGVIRDGLDVQYVMVLRLARGRED